MTIGEWIIAIITTVGILVALGIGVRSIKLTARIQKSERNQRVVKDIEQWAANVIRFLVEYQELLHPEGFWEKWQGQWFILKDSKTHMQEAASRIDKGFGQNISKAITDFDAIDNTADAQKRTRTNIANLLETSKNSCRQVLRTAGVLKFKELI